MFLVKKFCDMVGVNYSTLRHYERIGLLKPYQDEENGYRRYRPEDAFLVNTFKYYRSLGYDTKTALKLVKEPEKEYVREKLLERETELIKDAIHIRNQMKAIQHQFENFSFLDQGGKWRIGTRKDLWFLQVSTGYNFDLANYDEMAEWVEFLPLTKYCKHMKVSHFDAERENNVAAFGMSIEDSSAYLLTEESRRNAKFVPGGKCLYYYSATLGSPMIEAKIYEEICGYLKEHALDIYGDIYIEGVRVRDDCGQKGQIVSIPVKDIEE